jgi:hypothetical protein
MFLKAIFLVAAMVVAPILASPTSTTYTSVTDCITYDANGLCIDSATDLAGVSHTPNDPRDDIDSLILCNPGGIKWGDRKGWVIQTIDEFCHRWRPINHSEEGRAVSKHCWPIYGKDQALTILFKYTGDLFHPEDCQRHLKSIVERCEKGGEVLIPVNWDGK